jgi:[NiFe] hydrogenase assembly HybE family chaperone
MTDPLSAEADALTFLVEAAFQHVADERMKDIPILNPALCVAAVGMRPVDGAWLTVLVTPWCINLMLLPRNPEDAPDWASLPSGTKVKRQFPAGVFEFTAGAEQGLGPYRTCSLFSPVLEFECQEAAILTAEGALAALFDGELSAEEPDKAARAGQPGLSRRGLLFGGGKGKS